METLSFVAQASVLVTASLGVVVARTPLRSALSLILVQLQLAVFYVGLEAPFVAAMQVLVYAGAVMVLFVFVIMLLNQGAERRATARQVPLLKWAGAAAAVAVMVGVASNARQLVAPGTSPAFDAGVHAIGEVLLGRFLFAFEATSLLLLTAVVGAVVLGLKRLAP